MELSNKGVLKLSSDKYKIVDNQWIWNTDKYSLDELLDESDEEVLLSRGKYLVEVIDKIPGKLTYEDIIKLPTQKRLIIPYGPASGKTTAIRQFICRNYNSYILYATKLIKDVDKFYYDTLSVLKYYNINPKSYKISKYTSNHKLSVEECQSSTILITTHERLYRDPPSILYNISNDMVNMTFNIIHRQYIFIDEYIKESSTKYVDNNHISLISNINYLSLTGNDSSTDKDKRNLARTSIIYNLLINPSNLINQPCDINMLQLKNAIAKTTISQIEYYSKDKDFCFKYNKFNKRSVYSAVYFLNLLCEYAYTHESEFNESIGESKGISLEYNLPDFLDNIYIFDGTGDILYRTSKLFEIQNIPSRYMRKLSLVEPPILVENTSIDRSITTLNELHELSSNIYNKFIKSIENILDNNDGKLLIYTWKSIKKSDKLSKEIVNLDNVAKLGVSAIIDDFPKYIINTIDQKYIGRINIITYQSGKERVTSDYIDCNMIYMMGKFYIPQDAINKFNRITSSNSSIYDFTKSLIIQAIYRTSARLDKSIKLFFTNDYNPEFIKSILNEFTELSIINNNKILDSKILISKLKYNSRNQKYYKFIINNISKIMNSEELLVPNNERSSHFRSGINNYISNYPDLLEFIDTTKSNGRGNTSSFKILVK